MTIFTLPWTTLIPLLMLSCVVAYVAIMIAVNVFRIVWNATVYGMEAVIETTSHALAKLVVQLGAIVLCAAGAGLSAAWSPVQNRLDRLGEKAAKPETHAITVVDSDPFEIMSLPKSATQTDVVKRWKELQRAFHPDILKVSDWPAKRINAAYEAIFKINGWKQ